MVRSNVLDLHFSDLGRCAVRPVGHHQVHRHAGEHLNAVHRSMDVGRLDLQPGAARNPFLHHFPDVARSLFSRLQMGVARSLFSRRWLPGAAHSLIFHLRPDVGHSLHHFPGVARSLLSRLQMDVEHSLFLHRDAASLMDAGPHRSCHRACLDAGLHHSCHRTRLNAVLFPLLRLAWAVEPYWRACSCAVLFPLHWHACSCAVLFLLHWSERARSCEQFRSRVGYW